MKRGRSATTSSSASTRFAGGAAPSGAKGGLGQHFLKNPMVSKGIVDKAKLTPSDVVLEVGPGSGNLTVKILEQAKKVYAMELDPRMCVELKKRFSNAQNLEIIQGDVLTTEWPSDVTVLISNLPYQISSPVTFKLLAHRPMLSRAVIMFQEEFATRLCAPPSSKLYCRLSANTQLLSRVDSLMKVGRKNFRPPPKVDSRVVRITPHKNPPPVDFSEWDGLTRALFNRKNKLIRSNLTTKSLLAELLQNAKNKAVATRRGGDDETSGKRRRRGDEMTDEDVASDVKTTIDEVLSKLGFAERRAAKCNQDDFLLLLAELNERGVFFSS